MLFWPQRKKDPLTLLDGGIESSTIIHRLQWLRTIDSPATDQPMTRRPVKDHSTMNYE